MLETTLVIIVAAGIGLLVFLIRACYMSKCTKVKLGCMECTRDTTREASARNLKFEIPKP
jgi:hypothetical protein